MVMVDVAVEQVETAVDLMEMNLAVVEKDDCCVVIVIGVGGAGSRSGSDGGGAGSGGWCIVGLSLSFFLRH